MPHGVAGTSLCTSISQGHNPNKLKYISLEDLFNNDFKVRLQKIAYYVLSDRRYSVDIMHIIVLQEQLFPTVSKYKCRIRWMCELMHFPLVLVLLDKLNKTDSEIL